MPLRTSTQVKNRVASPSAHAADSPIVVFAEHIVVAGQLNLNDVLEMIPFPAGTIPVMIRTLVDDLDTGATLALDFGILSGNYGDADIPPRTCNTAFGAAISTAQVGGPFDT